MRLPGYRSLVLAWAAVLALLTGGVGTLAWLGPLPAPPVAQSPAVPDAPAAMPAVADPPAPAPTPAPT
ncbi:MAG: hypothetical protein O9325_14025, partial [Roseomonas sp.]|nr:hypothetical protein [Roseomonas sp.]